MSAEDLKKLNDTLTKLSEKVDQMETSIEEKNEQIKKLSDANSDREKLAQDEEKKATFNIMFKEGKVVEAQRESFIAGDTKKFAELSQSIKFDNLGHSVEGNKEEEKEEELSPEEAEEKLAKLAKEEAEAKNVSLSEATNTIIMSHPKLAEKYLQKFNL